jgi:hypothetical protein
MARHQQGACKVERASRLARKASPTQASQVENSEVETARKRLEEARRVRDDGRDGASPDWLRAVEDYVNKCQEEYVRALERAQSNVTPSQSGGGWPAADSEPRDAQNGERRPN